jgi:hypothetical protein
MIMLYYVPSTVQKTTCIGNSLSTINIGFSSLDTSLEELSSYAVESINFLSATMISVSSQLQSDIDFLSATMISVSSNLYNQINVASSFLLTEIVNTSSFLLTEINYVSATFGTEIDYISALAQIPDTIYHAPSGRTEWNAGITRRNVNLTLSSNTHFGTPTNLSSGAEGNIVITSSATSGFSITGYDNIWRFARGDTTMTVAPCAINLIRYYYTGSMLLSEMVRF